VTLLRADALHLRKVRADAITHGWLQKHRAHVTQREEAPYLDFTGTPDFEAYETRYSAKSRKNRRRLLRRLQGYGEVRLEHFTSGPEARAAAIEAIELKRRTLDDNGRIALALKDPRFAAFFADAAEGASHTCGCRVTRMTAGGRHVASCIDVNFRGHRAAHIIVHEPEFASCGPGLHLVEDWARTAHAEGFAQLDLLAPAHTYKWDWADGAIAVNDYARATTLKGRLFVAYLTHARPHLKALAERYVLNRRARRRAARQAAACEGLRG
jgi:CelD/BcsL family acetyltransferase involved in cellulose biosynthesis